MSSESWVSKAKRAELRLGLEGAEGASSRETRSVVVALGHWTGDAQSVRSKVAALLGEACRV